ncbi:MAG TPA: hypothetical protein VMW24_15280, partial [Sedimentisphaerales bacterium]|nr:hypothetical protein [Sedimentisphaerales bacterium]
MDTDLNKNANRKCLGGANTLKSAANLNWRTPAADPAAIKTDKLEGDLGSRMYNKETGRLAQYGLEQQVNWETPTVSSGG